MQNVKRMKKKSEVKVRIFRNDNDDSLYFFDIEVPDKDGKIKYWSGAGWKMEYLKHDKDAKVKILWDYGPDQLRPYWRRRIIIDNEAKTLTMSNVSGELTPYFFEKH